MQHDLWRPDERKERVASLAEKGDLPDARLEDGCLHFTALARSVPETAEEWTERAYDLLPRIKLTDLLTEVDGWTRFTGCVTHLHNNAPPKNKDVLLSAVLADATNQGMTKMADACPGLTFDSPLLDCGLGRSRGNVCEGAGRDHRTSITNCRFQHWGDGIPQRMATAAARVATLAMSIMTGIELFQFTMIPAHLLHSGYMLVQISARLIGTEFNVRDLLAYAVGIACTYLVDRS